MCRKKQNVVKQTELIAPIEVESPYPAQQGRTCNEKRDHGLTLTK